MTKRAAADVMPIAALGAIKPHRLSFARVLVRRMLEHRWSISLREVDVDESGVGRMEYDIDAEGHRFHFVIRSDDVPEQLRTGRLSESRFDGMGILCHGPLDHDRLDQEMREIQKRSAGRGSHDSLGWTLCSRSSRAFDRTVDALASGRQPTEHDLGGATYLLRNNGYYGNGRHGTRPWASLDPEHPLAHPYFPEMVSLYLWRQYGYHLAEAMARHRNSDAVPLSQELCRYLGVGNATGQGMSTFLAKWPRWMHAWNDVREQAFATVAEEVPSATDRQRAVELLGRVADRLRDDDHDDGVFVAPQVLAADVDRIAGFVGEMSETDPWEPTLERAERTTHAEAAEYLRSTLTEVHAPLVDPLAARLRAEMAAPPPVRPSTTVDELRGVLDRNYAWIDDVLSADGFHERFFYRSEEHGEQRVGERAVDAGSENETFTGVAHAVGDLRTAIEHIGPSVTVARLLVDHPELRFIVERVLSTASLPYAEVRADITSARWTPGEAGRFVLATFGMEHATAHTHRWVQGTFLQGAPTPEDLRVGVEIDWIHPAPPGFWCST